MRFIEIHSRDNTEETILAVRPNHIIAVKPYDEGMTKVLVQNFPHWILVDRNFDELLKELKSAPLRKKSLPELSKEG